MAKPDAVTSQTDFSNGELDPALKRADTNPAYKSGSRQMSNWRVLNSGGFTNRSGRKVLFLDGPRVEEVLMSPNNTFYLVFGNTYLRVYNAAGAKVFDSGNVMPWTTATAVQVVWDIYRLSIYVTFPGMQPRVLTWDGVSQVSTWTLSLYVEDGTPGIAQKRTVFYRLSQQGAQLFISGTVLAANQVVTVQTTGTAIFTPAHVGTRIRFINHQLLILTYNSPTSVVAITMEAIPTGVNLTAQVPNLNFYFNVGEVVVGNTSGARGQIAGFTGSNPDVMLTQKLTFKSFIAGEVASGPNASFVVAAVTELVGSTYQSTIWDDEVINAMRGYPQSCFVDQGRLGLCDFPALPGLIVWSAFGNFTDLYTDENNVSPDNAIQELVPGKSRVRYVVPGTEGSEFVFCDDCVYYIPITQATPLKPGSVAFNQITKDGSAAVQPRLAQQSVIFVSVGGDIFAVQAVGAYGRSYVIEGISALHAHLLDNPVAIAVPAATTQFEERYFYVLNGDGTIAICNYSFKSGIVDNAKLGWVPWSGSGTATWISARGPNAVFTGRYSPNAITPVMLVEVLDDTRFLDASMKYNAIPTALTPPSGKGPLWWIPLGSVDLMDGPLGTRMMGTYQIDANGFLVPQGNAGEDLTSVNLVVGQAWTATFEPFVPPAKEGQNMGQRMWPRRLKRVQVYVQNSTGFLMARIFSGPVTRTSPPIGTRMAQRRVTTWNQDDDPTQPPPLREQSYKDRPLGYSYDPRWTLVKDTPGPLIVVEIDTEVTI